LNILEGKEFYSGNYREKYERDKGKGRKDIALELRVKRVKLRKITFKKGKVQYLKFK
jgi:hypothetical protein